jgi:hypothetical protein
MTSEEQVDYSPCPITHAHRRLLDCHELWHAVQRNYMEPEAFRLNLNSLIQGLRSVTWLLQKQKATLPDFSEWYADWQELARQETIMAWIVRSRNRIVKEADLELLSQASVYISLDWLNEMSMSWNMPPRYTTRQILIRLLSTQDVPPVGVLTVERRWVDRLLPEHELLDACAHAYELTARVIAIAHAKNGVDRCSLPSRKLPCVTSGLRARLLCMHELDETRRLHINLETRAEVAEYVRATPGNSEKAVKRYGENPLTGDAIAVVPQIIEVNKKMLSLDGGLMTVAILMRGERLIGTFSLEFYDQASKRIAFHKVGDWVKRYNADGVVVVAESWVAFPDEAEFSDPNIVPARDRPDKQEAITVTGITKDGRTLEAMCIFTRDAGGQIKFGDTELTDSTYVNALEPVRRVWGQRAVDDQRVPDGPGTDS